MTTPIKTYDSYRHCAETAQMLFGNTDRDLSDKITLLGTNTKTLSELYAKPYTEVKATVKKLNPEMLTFYSRVMESSRIGLEAMDNLRDALKFLGSKSLDPETIEHMALHGYDPKELETEEKHLSDARNKIQASIASLQASVERIGQLMTSFKAALNNTLYAQGADENTNSVLSWISSAVGYPYLESALQTHKPPTSYAVVVAQGLSKNELP